MSKIDILDNQLQENKGYLSTSEAVRLGVSREYFARYVRTRGLERVTFGLYMSFDAWEDSLYVIQKRYPQAVFSHETALYLLNLAEREPIQNAVTLKAESGSARLIKLGLKVYKIKRELFDVGVTEAKSVVGHTLKIYNTERTLCDLVRNRRNIDVQDLQSAFKEYMRKKGKNIPLLMRYAEIFSVEKIIRQYIEILL